MSSNQLDYWREDKPRCPHCSKQLEVWGNDHALDLNYEDGGRTSFECESCGNEFICETNIRYSFSTAVSDEAADYGDWGPQHVEIDT